MLEESNNLDILKGWARYINQKNKLTEETVWVNIMKPGWKTTEFVITCVTIVATTAAALEKFLEPQWAAVAAALSSMAYSVSRGLAKK